MKDNIGFALSFWIIIAIMVAGVRLVAVMITNSQPTQLDRIEQKLDTAIEMLQVLELSNTKVEEIMPEDVRTPDGVWKEKEK